MQPRAGAVLALCAFASCAAAAEESLRLRASLLRASETWLQRHAGAPKADELSELKDENPEAYAIVKALLTKRSLGLLDPRHPSASFAAPPPSKDSVPQGPAVFAKFASKAELAKMEAPTAAPAEIDNSEVASLAPVRPANRNWLNWKPAQNDDDAMVSSVLGGDADRGTKSLIGRDRGSVSVTSAEVALPAPEVQPALTATTDMQPVKVQPILPLHAENAPAASQPVQLQPGALSDPKENNYLDTVGSFGVDFTPELKKTAGGQAVKRSVHEDHNNYLASFSWDDSKQAAPPAAQQPQQPLQPEAQQPTEQKQPQTAPATSSGDSGALMAWLGGGAKKTAQVQTHVEVQTTPKPTWQNSYMAELA